MLECVSRNVCLSLCMVKSMRCVRCVTVCLSLCMVKPVGYALCVSMNVCLSLCFCVCVLEVSIPAHTLSLRLSMVVFRGKWGRP